MFLFFFSADRCDAPGRFWADLVAFQANPILDHLRFLFGKSMGLSLVDDFKPPDKSRGNPSDFSSKTLVDDETTR